LSTTIENPLTTIERLLAATNAHDLEALVNCFTVDYALEAPLHPARSFRGRDQVRRNWTEIFGGVPNITAQIERTACDGDTVWSEWEMKGTRQDGAEHLMRGVFIFGVREGAIRWGRMFLEPVDHADVGIDGAVREQVGTGSGDTRR
jgi:ketosteroid isomerase-like protein